MALGYAGEMRLSLAWPAAVALMSAAVGMGLGQAVRGKVKAETFRLCFFIGILLLGTHLALRGIL
jgi:uncharacterized membrane protein YfcA